MILVNFKVYEQSLGEGAVRLAKICRRVEEKTKVTIIPVVSAMDIREVEGKVMVQNVDETRTGALTGKISAKAVQAAGGWGSLLNHSECRQRPGTIKKLLADWPKDFKSVVCIQSWGQAEGWAKKVNADFVAYEPKYLIGNKEKSVATEQPQMIKKLVEWYKPKPILVGAGIHSHQDVQIALELGAKGVLVASDVVLSAEPERELLELAEAFYV